MQIIGVRDDNYTRVTIDGLTLLPWPSQRVWEHSPDGFDWGYAGSGPAQLALGILLAAGVPADRAVRLHQRFKAEHIATLPQINFLLELDVLAWVDAVDGDH